MNSNDQNPANTSAAHGRKPRRLNGVHMMLLEDLKAGGILRRRGMNSAAKDLNFWLGDTKAYTQENRQTADTLVAHGLAEWYEYTEEESREKLATHELRLMPQAY